MTKELFLFCHLVCISLTYFTSLLDSQSFSLTQKAYHVLRCGSCFHHRLGTVQWNLWRPLIEHRHHKSGGGNTCIFIEWFRHWIPVYLFAQDGAPFALDWVRGLCLRLQFLPMLTLLHEVCGCIWETAELYHPVDQPHHQAGAGEAASQLPAQLGQKLWQEVVPSVADAASVSKNNTHVQNDTLNLK